MRSRGGHALVEVIISAVILAVASAAISSMLLSTYSTPHKSIVKHQMLLAERKLREELRAYVTADTSVTENAPGDPPWHLPEDTNCTHCWALSEGDHNATLMIPESLRVKYSAAMRYTVAWEGDGLSKLQKVDIVTEWEIPE